LIDKLLEPYKKQSLLAMRIGIAATLLLAWNKDAMLMPELRVPAEWIGWVQFVVVLLLLFPATVRIAGVCLGFLYLWQYRRPAGPVAFDFRMGRKQESSKRFLGDFEGISSSPLLTAQIHSRNVVREYEPLQRLLRFQRHRASNCPDRGTEFGWRKSPN
jgi:hypothetical protein